MRSLLGTLCALSVFAATGYSLSCTQCLNLNGISCSGTSGTCPTNQVCASVLLSLSIPFLGFSNRDMFTRTCAPQELCNLNGSFSFPFTMVTFASSCCSTDNCTSTLPTIPDNINQPNGLTCPTCFSSDGSLCDASQSIPCTGNENMCYVENAIATGFFPILARGCASKSVCDIANVEQLFIRNYLGYNANTLCSSAASNGTIYHGFLLPAAIFTALIKFMFG
uniref:UPAR/Ly6 domain-containing protein n=1 Tax=Xenopus tropicalis TaxID=8364 RepID=A0A803JXH3_XENTR